MAFVPSGRKGFGLGTWAVIAVIAIVAIIAVLFLAGSNGATQVSSSKNLTLGAQQSAYFTLPDTPSTYALYVQSSSAGSAVLYVSTLPVLSGRIAAFQISKGQMVNLSLGGSPVANLQVRLIAANSTESSIELSFIPRILNLKQSSGVSYINPSQGSNFTPTTTASGGNGSGKSTTVATTTAGSSTTTIPATTSAKALALANATTYGTLINNYKALYQKDKACVITAYDSEFNQYEGFAPYGPFSYGNVTPTVITNITAKASQLSAFGGNAWNVTYTSYSPALGATPILTININAASGTLINASFVGPFFGGFSYSKVNSTYVFQNSVIGTCGAYLPYH